MVKRKKEVSTTRNLRLVGTQSYISQENGEILDCQVIEVVYSNVNLQHIWFGHILSVIEEPTKTKMKVVKYLLDNVNAENVITKTIAEIVLESGISNKTIIETLKTLQRHDIITRKTGVIFLNPYLILKSGSKRQGILTIYSELPVKT
jgi:hypothetical protein